MDWLSPYNYDGITRVVVWSIFISTSATLTLLLMTYGMRITASLAARRQRRFLARWRNFINAAACSAEHATRAPLPRLGWNEKTELLEEWNRARDCVSGTAVLNLITLAHRTCIPRLARVKARSRRLKKLLLGIQTLGHLRESGKRRFLQMKVEDNSTAVSVTAMAALMETDPDLGVEVLMANMASRRDWPRNRVSILLRNAGSRRISRKLSHLILRENVDAQSYLLQFTTEMAVEIRDELVEKLLNTPDQDPRVLSSALKLVSTFNDLPVIDQLIRHPVWYVRMQAAAAVGRVGQKLQVPLLEDLLDDEQWWVRYRAAQALVALPFLGPNELRSIRSRQTDRFADDMLHQVYAEAGLA